MQTPPATQAPEWTIQRLLQWTTSYFDAHAIDSPRASAEILLAHTLSLRRIDLYLRYEQPLNPAELQSYKTLVIRRIKREPVAYIVGYKEFWSMEFCVTRDVLIPRPETECLVEAARARLPEDPGPRQRRVLELGTGSGAAILALAAQRPGHRYHATDRSVAALCLAARNARSHGLDAAVRFVCGDWFAPFAGDQAHFDLIFSNPPYIPGGDIERLQPEIHGYEPLGALDGGPDGLVSIRWIIQEAPRHLKRGGYLLLEIGHDQEEAVSGISGRTGRYDSITVTRDYAGHPRVASMRCT